MTYQITAARGSEVVRAAYAANRETADAIYGEVLRRHPDCEIVLSSGDAVLASSGPVFQKRGGEVA